MDKLTDALESQVQNLYVELDALRSLVGIFLEKVPNLKSPEGHSIKLADMGASELLRISNFIIKVRRVK